MPKKRKKRDANEFITQSFIENRIFDFIKNGGVIKKITSDDVNKNYQNFVKSKDEIDLVNFFIS